MFFRLDDLRDEVLVTRADGSVAVFAVDNVRRYHKSVFPTQVVYANTNRAAPRLTTCGGPFRQWQRQLPRQPSSWHRWSAPTAERRRRSERQPTVQPYRGGTDGAAGRS